MYSVFGHKTNDDTFKERMHLQFLYMLIVCQQHVPPLLLSGTYIIVCENYNCFFN